MPESHGFRARALHLVGVAALSRCMRGRSTRQWDTAGLLPRASRRSSAGVDAVRQSPARPVNPRLSGYAWYQNFNNGNQNNNNKGWRCRVRAVRK
ncbi:hypothetical protein [Shumkonia mesophila]|uniref:hypothetical protein n=1 Tax=Shumkonia mesophila TaxID=2838854 RepID=UPI0029342D1A|nr:hypothetical protein [Shumkonia mesophila]